MMISGHKMVKKRLFRLELFCPSLPAILDEIPQLIFLCIIPLPVVISQLTGMYSLPVWLLWVAFLSGAYFWLSATLKFVRSVSKGKFRLTDSVAICLFLLLIPCATISKAFYSPIFGEGDSNAVNVMLNRWGRIVRRIERKDGKLNGLFMMDYDWGSVKGTYKNDIEIGKWVGWYPGKKQLLFEAFFDEDPEAITNRSGGVEFSPRLIDCTCYAPDGKVCGSVSNGVGCEVRYLPDNSIDFLKTYGYETNYFVLFHGGGMLKGQIRQLEISLKDSSAPFFKIGVFRENGAFPLSFVEENGSKATILEDGKAIPGNDKGFPDFILGKSSYAIPRPDNGHLAFDHMVFCSNATLHVISADGRE